MPKNYVKTLGLNVLFVFLAPLLVSCVVRQWWSFPVYLILYSLIEMVLDSLDGRGFVSLPFWAVFGVTVVFNATYMGAVSVLSLLLLPVSSWLALGACLAFIVGVSLIEARVDLYIYGESGESGEAK
jgi:hypothetical protein